MHNRIGAVMKSSEATQLSRRNFCLCCVGAASYAATSGWLTPREAFAEARGLVTLIKDSAAASEVTTHSLRNNISVLEGSGGNIAVLTGSDGKVQVDAGISVSRPRLTKALDALGKELDHRISSTRIGISTTPTATNGCMRPAPRSSRMRTRASILSGIQRVEDWDYNFLPGPHDALPADVFAKDHKLKLNGATISLQYHGPAHTDGDITVHFAEANVVHAGDTYWNGIYPFTDYSDRRQHRR